MKTGDEIGLQILEFLGIPKDGVLKLTVVCEAGKPATVAIEKAIIRNDHNVVESFIGYEVIKK